ncbi:protein of unknown function [Pseudomonas mediterranea]
MPLDHARATSRRARASPKLKFRVGTERNTGLLIRSGKAEVPALGAFRIHEKGEAVVVREGVDLGTGFGVSDSGIGESRAEASLFNAERKCHAQKNATH